MERTIITDEQLANRLASGDLEAAAAIYERHKTGLFRFCVRLLMDAQAAEDAVHETFVKMMTHSRTLHHPSSLKSWLFTVARNEALSLLKRKKMYREYEECDEEIFIDESIGMDIDRADLQKNIIAILDTMLPQYKEVLMLREYEMMNYEEIAAVTGSSVSSVKSRLFKARKALMQKLQPYRKEIIV